MYIEKSSKGVVRAHKCGVYNNEWMCTYVCVREGGGMVRIWCDPDIKRVLKKIWERV